MVNQRELLIKHFESRTSISGVEAANIYKIRSLPRRILDLKEMGYENVANAEGGFDSLKEIGLPVIEKEKK